MADGKTETAGGRRSGHTLRMVNALPSSGSVVMVHSSAMRDYIRAMIQDVRGQPVSKATKVIVINRSDSVDLLMGSLLPVFVDHAVWTNVSEVTAQRLERLADGANARHPEVFS